MDLKVKEFAARERVTERTVWTWIQKGAVEIRRTPGGGVRIVERRDSSGVVVLQLGDRPSAAAND